MFIVPNSTNVLAQISPNAPRPTTVSLLGKNRILDRNTNDTVRRIDFTKNRFYNFPMQAYYILFPKIMYSKITSIYYENSSHLKTEWPSLIYIAITRDLTRETYASIKLLYQTFITLRTKTICLPHQTYQKGRKDTLSG